MARRFFVGMSVGWLGLAACSRTPPEPAPTATTTSELGVRAGRASAPGPAPAPATPPPLARERCIAKWPSSPAPIPTAAKACPADPEPNLSMPTASVAFASGLKIDVELAKTAHDVERGLMYRQAMSDDHGMLFKLDGKSDHMFWMHNTCLPLDMMFVDEDGLIVGIVEGAEPLTDTTRSVGCPSLFVLEVIGGWSRKHGVAPGQTIALPSAIR